MKRCSESCTALVVFLGTLAFYVPTIATTVGWTDAGELMAVAATLGIAHPTGYPLLTLLSRAWLLIPFDLRTVTQLSLFVCVLVSIAGSLFYLLLGRLVKFRATSATRGERWPRLAATGLFVTSTTVWTQAVSFEAYALQLVLFIGILAAWFTAIDDQSASPRVTSRWWFLFALLVGFGFANHLTTVLLAPALLWHYLRTFGNSPSAWRRLLRMVPFCIVGLTVYLLLPIRSAVAPPLNWGSPSTWELFWAHVGGAQYRLWMFTGGDVMARQAGLFFGGLPGEFVIPCYLASMWGFVVFWRTQSTSAVTFFLLALTTFVYSINYDIHEIGPYFLPFYVIVALLAGVGLVDLRRRLSTQTRFLRVSLPVFALSCVVWQAIVHREDVRRAVPTLVEEFAGTVLRSVPSDALVLTGRWDYFFSPALYLQHVEKIRTDVIVIDHSLLRDHSWYLDEIRRKIPFLDSALTNEFEHFRRELRKFELEVPFSPAVIQFRWNALIDGIVRVSLERGVVFVDNRLGGEVRGWGLRPDGYLLRVFKPNDSSLYGSLPPSVLIDAKESAFLDDFRDYCAVSYLQHASHVQQAGRWRIADSLAVIAQGLSPMHPVLAAFRLQQKKLGD